MEAIKQAVKGVERLRDMDINRDTKVFEKSKAAPGALASGTVQRLASSSHGAAAVSCGCQARASGLT